MTLEKDYLVLSLTSNVTLDKFLSFPEPLSFVKWNNNRISNRFIVRIKGISTYKPSEVVQDT